MGQYHTPCVLDAMESINGNGLDSGVKLVELARSLFSRLALTVLFATPEGDAYRDGSWSPATGRWAGDRMMVIGDYAEEGDLLPWEEPVREPDLYFGKQASSMAFPTRKEKGKTLSIEICLLPTIERITGSRFSKGLQLSMKKKIDENEDTFSFSMPVRYADEKWVMNAGVDPNTIRWYERMLQNNDEATLLRRPLDFPKGSEAVSGFVIPEDGDDERIRQQGVERLWVNIDRMEYIDPALLERLISKHTQEQKGNEAHSDRLPNASEDKETHDLFDVAYGESAFAILMMTAHKDQRGGGDGNAMEGMHVRGRWRGQRIALTGPTGRKKKGNGLGGKKIGIPGVDTVRKTFRDMTWAAFAAVCFSDCEEGFEFIDKDIVFNDVVDTDTGKILDILSASEKFRTIIQKTVTMGEGENRNNIEISLIPGGKLFVDKEKTSMVANDQVLVTVGDGQWTADPETLRRLEDAMASMNLDRQPWEITTHIKGTGTPIKRWEVGYTMKRGKGKILSINAETASAHFKMQILAITEKNTA